MNGALKAAWALTAFVVLVGAIGWATTGRAVFSVFLVLGILTAVGAALMLRSVPPASTRPEKDTP
ncbi:hypothetical protein GB931_05250 [Modestobacter sp. I12A-02628]|uniref:Uncharacterized protein n=1 Tax=Goekera deserti TaxID=2497753 RepID=A0A7K3WH66_9ACTN|nr:hypothetical protein [Goekera deserti]MPQ97339.1 hypothetical protein [Goekera deserti]NDI50148.1 hypothetical protein [Goekera deserti]NEL55716.1 hypothetical protein [Goekera deserti]